MAEPLRRRIRALTLDKLTWASSSVPRSWTQAGLGGLAGLARFSRFEERTLRNLELALGDETSLAERRRIARGVRRHGARLFAEWLRLADPKTDKQALGRWIDDQVELDGSIEILEREQAKGRGVLVVTAHLGNWELCCARLARLGLTGAVIGYTRPRDSSGRWLERMRANYGVSTYAQDSSPRKVLEVLRGGEVLGLLCDLEVRRLDGVFTPFFGQPALTMTAPAALARAQGTGLLPLSCVLPEPGAPRYRLRVEPPLELDRSLDRKQATSDLLARMNRTFERWIRESPEQWAWHQARWRTRPSPDLPLIDSPAG